MIVCSCNFVADRDIKKAIDQGASSLTEVGEACSAGTSCGGCHKTIKCLLSDGACGRVREEREQGPALSPGLVLAG